MSKIHQELFDPQRQSVFTKLAVFKEYGYLAGGTALALQINHRKSYDFDIFVPNAVDNALKLKVNKVFGNVNYSLNTSDQINFETENQIKVSFVWYYFPALNTPIQTESLSLATIDDIACDKAHTIGRRAMWRDYVDMYSILKSNRIDFAKIIELAQQKFRGEFVTSLFLEQLVFFEDVQVVPIEFVGPKIPEAEIKSFLINVVTSYTSAYLKT